MCHGEMLLNQGVAHRLFCAAVVALCTPKLAKTGSQGRPAMQKPQVLGICCYLLQRIRCRTFEHVSNPQPILSWVSRHHHLLSFASNPLNLKNGELALRAQYFARRQKVAQGPGELKLALGCCTATAPSSNVRTQGTQNSADHLPCRPAFHEHGNHNSRK